MADHAVRLTDSRQEIAEATYARNRFFPHDACETEHAVSPVSSAEQQRLLPENKHEGEQTNEA